MTSVPVPTPQRPAFMEHRSLPVFTADLMFIGHALIPDLLLMPVADLVRVEDNQQ